MNTPDVITDNSSQMRKTILILCEHVPIQLAELIESYILPGDSKGGIDFVSKMFEAGHWELLSQGYFSEYWSSHCGLIGAIRCNSIHLVRVMVNLSTENMYDYIRIAYAHNCDRDIIELLQSRDDRDRKKMRTS